MAKLYQIQIDSVNKQIMDLIEKNQKFAQGQNLAAEHIQNLKEELTYAQTMLKTRSDILLLTAQRLQER